MESNLRTEPLGVVIVGLIFATIALSACTDDAVDLGTTVVAMPLPSQASERSTLAPVGNAGMGKPGESTDDHVKTE